MYMRPGWGGGLGSEITPWVEWVTGDEALGPVVGADSELVSRAPTGRGAGFLCVSGLIVCVENLGCTLLELAVHVARISLTHLLPAALRALGRYKYGLRCSKQHVTYRKLE